MVARNSSAVLLAKVSFESGRRFDDFIRQPGSTRTTTCAVVQWWRTRNRRKQSNGIRIQQQVSRETPQTFNPKKHGSCKGDAKNYSIKGITPRTVPSWSESAVNQRLFPNWLMWKLEICRQNGASEAMAVWIRLHRISSTVEEPRTSF